MADKHLIYKEDLKETVSKMVEIPTEMRVRMLGAITLAKTVDAVEVVHGRWIEDGGIDEDGNGQYRCSCCGAGEKHYPTVPVSYCWNCGAKMDGGAEDGK